MTVEIIQGDCRDVLELMPSASVHAVVTDPPYGLNFMGKSWDYDVPGVEVWRECLRVLKPGGHLLAFFGTRTYHRGVVAIEDAGFEIRDQIGWLYGSGFPKSSNQHGEWEGWGTALKPAWEPIVVARKPLIGTVPANLEAWGVGAFNIDDCRVGSDGGTKRSEQAEYPRNADGSEDRSQHWARTGHEVVQLDLGRWPANVIHDGSDEVLQAFPSAPGQLADASTSSSSRKTQNVYGDMKRGNGRKGEASADSDNEGAVGFKMKPGARRADSGSAARFFYCAKASRTDRNDGLEGFDKKPLLWSAGTKNPGSFQSEGTEKAAQNPHPTVKPTELMRYLCRLITPPGGTVLDPFMGSGSTGRGAVLEGFNFIGIERDAQYAAIAQARIAAATASVMTPDILG